jgi:hypothetical protein
MLLMKMTALLAPLAAFSCASERSARNNVSPDLELPPYEVELAEGEFEVRRYAPVIVARTLVQADSREAASREGFRRLAGYIFGGNQAKGKVAMTAPVDAQPISRPDAGNASQKIAMTAPVDALEAKTGLWEIAFTMPSEWTRQTLPVPNDARVALVEKPARRMAAVVFSGSTSDVAVGEKTRALEAWVRARKLGAESGSEGEPLVSRYNDPLTFPWNRRNEVQLALPD